MSLSFSCLSYRSFFLQKFDEWIYFRCQWHASFLIFPCFFIIYIIFKLGISINLSNMLHFVDHRGVCLKVSALIHLVKWICFQRFLREILSSGSRSWSWFCSHWLVSLNTILCLIWIINLLLIINFEWLPIIKWIGNSMV